MMTCIFATTSSMVIPGSVGVTVLVGEATVVVGGPVASIAVVVDDDVVANVGDEVSAVLAEPQPTRVKTATKVSHFDTIWYL
ncbi:MAG TPA: hypothetical protein VEB69_08575 [Acidimicrobiia bacterium]|nr:hypothetical protein [Acidimicrobiia bacterium]